MSGSAVREKDLEAGGMCANTPDCAGVLGCFRGRKVWYGILITVGGFGNSWAMYDYSQDDTTSASLLCAVSTTLWVAACGIRILATEHTIEENVNRGDKQVAKLTGEVSTLGDRVKELEDLLAQSEELLGKFRREKEDLTGKLGEKNSELEGIKEELRLSTEEWQRNAENLCLQFKQTTQSLMGNVQKVNEKLLSGDSADISDLADQVDRIEDGVFEKNDALKEKVAELKATFVISQNQVKLLADQTTALKKERDAMRVKIDQLGETITRLEEGGRNVKEAVEGLEGAGSQLGKNLDKMDGQLDKMLRLKRLEKQLRGEIAELTEVNEELVRESNQKNAALFILRVKLADKDREVTRLTEENAALLLRVNAFSTS